MLRGLYYHHLLVFPVMVQEVAGSRLSPVPSQNFSINPCGISTSAIVPAQFLNNMIQFVNNSMNPIKRTVILNLDGQIEVVNNILTRMTSRVSL